jgi:hypothetical protein
MRTDLAHFTINGTPLCECQYVANHERLRAAGSPRCEATLAEQLAKFAALAAQFPGRVAMVHGACPSLGSMLQVPKAAVDDATAAA